MNPRSLAPQASVIIRTPKENTVISTSEAIRTIQRAPHEEIILDFHIKLDSEAPFNGYNEKIIHTLREMANTGLGRVSIKMCSLFDLLCRH